jgi:phosphocarrier protein HPr
MVTARREVRIPNPQGMHARPIALMVSTAVKYQAKLFVACEGREVDGRSVLQLMTIAAPQGSVLTIRAEGADAEDQVAAVATVVENGFGEM